MAVEIPNTTHSASAISSGPYSLSVVRAAGEGFLVSVFWGYDFGAPSGIASVVWDPAGDNQALVLLEDQVQAVVRRQAVYYLAAPTSVKTADVVVTFDGATLGGASVLVRHITGHSGAAMVTASEKFVTDPFDSTHPISDSISSASGELCVDFLCYRNHEDYPSAEAGQDGVFKDLAWSSSVTHASSKKAGAASVAMGWTTSETTSYDNSHVMVALAPAAGGGGATINLTATDTTLGLTSGTGEADIDPPAPGTVNLAGADTTFGITSGTGVVDIDPAVGSITSDVFTNYSNIAQIGVTIPNVMLIKLDRTVSLSLANQVTNGSAQLVIASASLVVGTEYMLATFNADGTLSGMKKYTAV